MIKDTSIFEARIHDRVSNMCLEAIVSEAFIGSVPVNASELNDGLTHALATYAMECMKDLGGYSILKEAIEQTKDPIRKSYLRKMDSICMEAATTVTQRIIEECKGDHESLEEASKNVTMTPEEYNRFAKVAASLTPKTLTDMIQKKTLNTIKEERDAYKRDEELKTELINALNEVEDDTVADDDSIEQISTEPESKEGAEIGQSTEAYGAAAVKIAQESHFVDVQNESQKKDAKCDDKTGAQIGQACCGGECAKKQESDAKRKAAFEAYMKSIAGENYRSAHSTFFSKLQELAYESICATTESYTDLPFETMTMLTKQNTLSKFKSHNDRSLKQTMESVSRYAFESAGVLDAPKQKGALTDSLVVASIIYTFFETLNSMNLYCPKLAEIKRFVDESLPVEAKVLKDKELFEGLFKTMIARADTAVSRATTVPELDAVQKELDIVRERAATPGFESMKKDIEEKIDGVSGKITKKRDALIEKQRPVGPAVESVTQTLQRTRDTLKFSRIASTMGRKPNVSMVKCKVDPQKNSKYVAIECYTPNGRLANNTTVVLESAMASSDLCGYVADSIRASKLMELDKRIVVADSRSGKVYMDSAK